MTNTNSHPTAEPPRPGGIDPGQPALEPAHLGLVARFWRNRTFARIRHRMGWMRRTTGVTTRMHAKLVILSRGRIARSFIFTGGMPILVITTTGRRSGKPRSTPLGYLKDDGNVAVIASNAGSDRTPAWWLNLQKDPTAEILIERQRQPVRARLATQSEDQRLWSIFAALNPGFGEYRNLTTRRIPVVILEPMRK